jgi:hypothetical protein
VLAEANATSNAELVPGTSLRVPSVRVSANDSSTFKPYNPGEIIGSTAPGLPYIEKPKEAGCSAIAMIIMAVVAVVVTVYTAGAMSGAVAAANGALSTTAATAGAMSAGTAALSGGAIGAVAGGTMSLTAFATWRRSSG